MVSHQDLYVESIARIPGFHHSQIKWSEHLSLPLDWDNIWDTVHNSLNTNKTTSVIWQQLHLNFYTQYSYNKWHKVNMACPLCGRIPDNIFHLILDCELVSSIWREITPILLSLHPTQPNKEEKSFGIVQTNPPTAILVRNWLTFLVRHCISKMERQAHYCPSNIIPRTKKKIQHCIEKELDKKHFVSLNDGSTKKFEEIYAYRNVICRMRPEGKYTVTKIFS